MRAVPQHDVAHLERPAQRLVAARVGLVHVGPEGELDPDGDRVAVDGGLREYIRGRTVIRH